MKQNKLPSEYAKASQRMLDEYLDDIRIYVRGMAFSIEAKTREQGMTLEELNEEVEETMQDIENTIELRDKTLESKDMFEL